MKKLSFTGALLALFSGAGFSGIYAAENRPDIIVIMTDQQTYDMISYGTQQSLFATPNLDRIFSRGTCFSNCYVANPVSVPSRFSLMTGDSPARYGVRDNLGKYSNPDETAIRALQKQGLGALFSQNGYDTYYGGKVHLPYAHGKSNMFASTENYQFDTYLTRDDREQLSDFAVEIIKGRGRDKPMLMVLSYLNPHDICAEAGKDLPEESTGRDSLTAETIKEMRLLADNADPEHFPPLPVNFEKTRGLDNLLKLPYQDFTGTYWRRYRFIYHRLVELVDRQIGVVLDAIEASAIAGNTILVFTSDHGEMGGSHRLRTKNVPYSECQRVPFVFAGKGIDGPRTDTYPVCNGYDLLPTLCELGGIPIPADLPGISLVSRLQEGSGQVALPEDTRRILLLEGMDFFQIVDGNAYKYTRFGNAASSEILIDLESDPYETINVKDDPFYAVTLQRLRSLLEEETAKRGISITPTGILHAAEVVVSGPSPAGKVVIEGAVSGSRYRVFDLAGLLLIEGEVMDQPLTLTLPHKGIFVIQHDEFRHKVVY